MRNPSPTEQTLHEALIDAFPTGSKLAQMVRFQLKANLNEISEGSNLNDIIFELILWAEANGRMEELIQGAVSTNPGNRLLKKLTTNFENRKSISVTKLKLSWLNAKAIVGVAILFLASILIRPLSKHILVRDSVPEPTETVIPKDIGSSISCQNTESHVYAVSWSPNGKYIASGLANGKVEILDSVDLSNVLWYLPADGCAVMELSWGDKSTTLNITYGYTSDDPDYPFHTGTKIWSFLSNKIYAINGNRLDLSGNRCAPNGEMIAVGESRFGIVKINQDIDDSCASSDGYPYASTIGTPSWSSDSRYVALGNQDGKVLIKNSHDIDSRIIVKVHGNPVSSTSWSPDATQLVSGASDGTLRLWTMEETERNQQSLASLFILYKCSVKIILKETNHGSIFTCYVFALHCTHLNRMYTSRTVSASK